MAQAIRSAPARAASSEVGERRCPPPPGSRSRRAGPDASLTRPTSSAAWCGSSPPLGSWTRARVALMSGNSLACSTSWSMAPGSPGLYTSPAWNSLPASTIASPGSRRFETSLSGSWRRKTSTPFSAAEETKRRTKSDPTGREPTRKRPRSASPSGVVVRAFRARIRSHGLSTPRLTAVSKTPPPEISRQAKPALSSTSAIPSSSPVGTLPASGSCESRRIVVSMRRGTSGSLPSKRTKQVNLVRSMPANESALVAREGDCVQATFERLQRGHPVEEDPESVAAHRARPLLVSGALTHRVRRGRCSGLRVDRP